jgi:hypothetical protein
MAKIASSNPNSAHPLNEGVKYFGRSMSGSGQTVMMAPKHDFRSSPNTDIIGSDRHVSNVPLADIDRLRRRSTFTTNMREAVPNRETKRSCRGKHQAARIGNLARAFRRLSASQGRCSAIVNPTISTTSALLLRRLTTVSKSIVPVGEFLN